MTDGTWIGRVRGLKNKGVITGRKGAWRQLTGGKQGRSDRGRQEKLLGKEKEKEVKRGKERD